MPRTKGSKNKVNVQKQKQTQIVNVNINQEKKVTKRKPRAKKDSKPKTPIIYQYGEPVLGKPSDNLLYNSPPVIAQVIPQIGRESQAILPPKDTGVESILSQIKNKTERIVQSGKSKILSDTGSSEILNIEPKKKKGLSDTGATEILNIEPKKKKGLSDTGATEILNKEPKVKRIKGCRNATNQTRKKTNDRHRLNRYF